MFESGKTITGSELCKTGLEVFHKPDLEPRNTTWIRKFALHNTAKKITYFNAAYLMSSTFRWMTYKKNIEASNSISVQNLNIQKYSSNILIKDQ